MLNAPKPVFWPEFAGPADFIDVFDWDWFILNPFQESTLNIQIRLCTSYFPCALTIVGDGFGSLNFGENASIACIQSEGCNSMTITLVHIDCMYDLVSFHPAFVVDGAMMIVADSSFSGCHSIKDGGTISSYNEAIVTVHNCTFLNSHSRGMGGAINVLGSSLLVTSSKFSNCSSLQGGGAVSVAEYVCYGRTTISSAPVVVESCVFENCSSQGFGGAFFATSALANATIFDFLMLSW